MFVINNSCVKNDMSRYTVTMPEMNSMVVSPKLCFFIIFIIIILLLLLLFLFIFFLYLISNTLVTTVTF